MNTDNERLYSKKRFDEEKIEKILRKHPEDIMFLYRVLKYSDFKGNDCEKLCKYLLDNFDIFDRIPQNLTYACEAPKKDLGWDYKEYRSDSRKGEPIKSKENTEEMKNGKHKRKEDYLAMRIFKQCRNTGNIYNPKPIEKLGYILDYQMPIGGTKKLLLVKEGDKYEKNDKYGLYDPSLKDNLYTPGKCDLITFLDNSFTILELKDVNSKEPMIRAVLEAYTYLKMLDTERAEKSLREYYNELFDSIGKTKWKASLLLYYNGDQIKELSKENTHYLKELMKKLKIDIIKYKIEDDVIKICDK